MNQEIIQVLRTIAAHPESLPALAPYVQNAVNLAADQVTDLVQQLAELVESPELSARREPLDQGVQTVLQGLVMWRQQQKQLEPAQQEIQQQALEAMYLWSSPDSGLRNLLLAWMAISGTDETPFEPALRRWSELICQNPPENRNGIQLAFGGLMRRDFDPPMWLLESLLHQGIVHSQIAPAIFDLFNFYFRNGILAKHPAEGRADQLTALIAKIGESLRTIESGDIQQADPNQVGKQVSDSVAMIVALADALGQLDYQPAISVLEGLLDLKHRRVQTEVAAALAKLGSKEGKRALIQLADEPVCRLRVLAFAEELGFENEISLEYRGEIARAESELAIWLSEPQQVGVAPTTVRLLDSRDCYWPSYEEPRTVYLFEYVYGQRENATRNIGMAGPLVYAFPADLTELALDEVYGLFAGWQTVHEGIFQMSVEQAEKVFAGPWAQVMKQLEMLELVEPIVQTAASFFDQLTAVVSCRFDDENGEQTPGTVIVDADSASFIPQGNPNAPIDWELALCIWRGQRLLKTFNPVSEESSDSMNPPSSS